MPAIIIPRKWTQQPLGLVKPSQIAKDNFHYLFLPVSTGLLELFRHELLPTTIVIGPGGFSTQQNTGRSISGFTTGIGSVLCVGQHTSTRSAIIAIQERSGGGEYHINPYYHDTGSTEFSVVRGAGLSYSDESLPTRQNAAIAVMNGANAWACKNGSSIVSASITPASTASGWLVIQTDADSAINSYLYMAAISRYALSTAFCTEITKNPWQLFERDPQRLYFDVSTGLPTLTSIAASNITSSGARLTVN